MDTNSAYFAKFCFSLGINLKRIEVIADDEGEIVEAVRRMSSFYDFVVTSGGIGPTYAAVLGSAFANADHVVLQARRHYLSVNSKSFWATVDPASGGVLENEATITTTSVAAEL